MTISDRQGSADALPSPAPNRESIYRISRFSLRGLNKKNYEGKTRSIRIKALLKQRNKNKSYTECLNLEIHFETSGKSHGPGYSYSDPPIMNLVYNATHRHGTPVGFNVLHRAGACPLHVRLFEKPVLAAAKHVPVREYLQDFRLETLGLKGIRPA